MQPAEDSEVALLLQRWGHGDSGALDRLIPIVYERLHQLAHRRLKRENGEQSLNTTALVHEAYIRLVSSADRSLRDRSHFFALASRVMRNLLVDRARARNTEKRGGTLHALFFADELELSSAQADAVTDLNEALERLRVLNERQAQVLEQKYFGGLSLEEIAAAMDVSTATAKRDLRAGRAWLASELGGVPSVVFR